MQPVDQSLTSERSTVALTAVMSVVALVVSVWTAALTTDDESRLRQMETRLACLELPGPNDCGLDGR